MKHSDPHMPPLHTSPAAQAVPLGSAGCTHVPAPSHWSVVHALPSSVHMTPAPLFATTQPPLPSHVEVAWHGLGVHVKAVPAQTPAVHMSFDVHALPSSHMVPSLRFDQPDVLVAGTHAWQAFAGLIVPAP